MAVPYTFQSATGSIPLSQLDSNFATAITIGNTAVVLGDTITTMNNLILGNVSITSVANAFPNGYLANSNVIVGTTTLTLGSTVTSINGLSLSNVTISSGNVTISNVTTTNVTATTANVTTANIGTLVVIGDATVGGNTTVTGNITAAKGTFTSANITGTANVQIIAVTQDANIAGNVTATGNVTGAKGTFTSANVSGTANVQVIAVTQNATVAGNVTITGNVSAANGTFTSANVSGTANVSTLAVIGNVTIGGNATVTGNVSMNVATITTANVSGTANVSTLVVTANQTSLGNITATGNVTASSFTSTSTFGFKNRIINGAASIWQRGTTFSSINNTVTYGSDRFFAFTTSATAQAQILRSTSVPTGFLYSQQFGRAASNTATAQQFLCQCIESWNMLDLAGQTVTLSFWAKAGANYSGGSLSIKLSTGTTADQSAATFSGGPCTGYTGNQAAINATQAITTTWTQYTFTSSAIQAGALSMGLGIGYTPTGTAGADDNIYITGVQLEKGSTATSFDYRPYGTELALCQRYYQNSYDIGTAPATATTVGMRAIGFAISGVTTGYGAVFLQLPMRSAPTIAIYDGAGTVSNVSTVSSGSTTFTNGRAQSAVPFNISTNTFVHQGQAIVASVLNFIHFTASAEL